MRRFYSFLLIPVLVIIGMCCTSTQHIPVEPVGKDPKITPAWKNNPPKADNTNHYFVGVSRRFSTVADARDDAADNARRQVLAFYGQHIENNGVEKSSFSGRSRDTFNASISSEREILDYAESVITEVQRVIYYTETYLDKNNDVGFEAYVLCTLPRKVAEDHFRDFEQKISDQYYNLLKQDTVLDTLSSCDTVYKALEKNLIHRAVARLDDGKTSLYHYVSNQPNIIANNVAISHMPDVRNIIVQKTDTLEVSLKANSSFTIGNIDCVVRVEGPNNLLAKDTCQNNGNNSYTLTKNTTTLPLGRYTVRYELPLKDFSPLIKTNPGGNFSFKVEPVTATVTFTGDAEAGQKNTIFKALQTGLKPYEITLLEEGKTPPVRDLQNHYAFKVDITQSEPRSQGTIATVFDLTARISFERNGERIGEIFQQRITESFTNKTRAFVAMADSIGQNSSFFENIQKGIGL